MGVIRAEVLTFNSFSIHQKGSKHLGAQPPKMEKGRPSGKDRILTRKRIMLNTKKDSKGTCTVGVYPGRGTAVSNSFSYHQSSIPTIIQFPAKLLSFLLPAEQEMMIGSSLFRCQPEYWCCVPVTELNRYIMINKAQVL